MNFTLFMWIYYKYLSKNYLHALNGLLDLSKCELEVSKSILKYYGPYTSFPGSKTPIQGVKCKYLHGLEVFI